MIAAVPSLVATTGTSSPATKFLRAWSAGATTAQIPCSQASTHASPCTATGWLRRPAMTSRARHTSNDVTPGRCLNDTRLPLPNDTRLIKTTDSTKMMYASSLISRNLELIAPKCIEGIDLPSSIN